MLACRAPVCVGLDPVLERLPASLVEGGEPVDAIERFSLAVLDAVEGVVPAVKPQSACFERYGAAGVAALERVIRAARGRFSVILDWKRGDIGISSVHYAAAALRTGAEWVTASAYLGMDGIRPFLEAGLGVFALVRTSNEDGDRIQGERLAGGGTVAERVARLVAEEGGAHLGACGLSSLGAVVGATKAAEAARLREIMPQQVFLVPGFGAQGAKARDAAAAFRSDGRGAIVSASRSVLYPFRPDDPGWQVSIRAAAEAFACEIAGAVGRRAG